MTHVSIESFDQLASSILDGKPATEDDALAVLRAHDDELIDLVAAAGRCTSARCSRWPCRSPTRSSSATTSPPRARPPAIRISLSGHTKRAIARILTQRIGVRSQTFS